MREKSASDRPGRHRRQPKLTDRTYLYHYRTVHLIRHTIETHLMGRPGINLLDVGCGSKPYEPLFRSAVERYIGCDIVPGPFVDVVCQAEALSVAANSVDVVASFSVLEHVEDPSRSVVEIYRVLKPGGLAIVSVPGVYVYHPTPADYWRWTQAGITRLFGVSPFQAVTVSATGGAMAATFTLANIYLGLALGRLGRSRYFPALVASAMLNGFTTLMNLLGASLERAWPALSDITKENTLIAGFLVVAQK